MVSTSHDMFPKLSTPTVTPQGNNWSISQHFPPVTHHLPPAACPSSTLPLLPPSSKHRC